MKRILSLAAAVLLFVGPSMAQSTVKVDADGIRKKIERSDADIANEKKNTKPAAWIDRGKIFTEAATAPSTGLYRGLDEVTMTLLVGKPSNTSEKQIDDITYTVLSYPNFEAYMNNGQLIYWEPKLIIVDNGLDEAYRSYSKAYEIDNKSGSKIRGGIIDLANAYKQEAENLFAMQKYQAAAENFRKAYDVQMHPAVNIIDTFAVFNAGFLFTVAQDNANALDNLKKALELGYENGGDTYYYMYHAYYGQEKYEDARVILLEALGKYPDNNRIVEGLITLYSMGDNDPKEIIPIVQKAIEADPENPELWGGLGRIYDKLDEPEKAIEAFAHSASLLPDDFGANFNLGLLYLKQGDKMIQEYNNTTMSIAEGNAFLEKINGVYRQAIAPLERALAISPNELGTVQLLMSVTFRLRDEEGIMEKYEHYEALFNQLQGE